ncbi:MAG: hypothetical protein R2873_08255 [Caldilineaceae bacterium]
MAFEPFSEVQAMSGGTGAEWIPPISEYETVPGGRRHAIGEYTAEIRLPQRRAWCRTIPRRGSRRFLQCGMVPPSISACRIAGWVDEPAGLVFGRCAGFAAFLHDNVLQIGDQISILVITDAGQRRQHPTVAGVYTLLPLPSTTTR